MMTRLSPSLLDYLRSSDAPKQVLIKVLARHRPPAAPFYPDYRKVADANRADLLNALRKERDSDRRVQFEALGVGNQVSLKAPPDVIFKIARLPDVEDIVPDEPEDAL
jgi:hypothetical protein